MSETDAMPSRPLTRAEVAEQAERVRQLLADERARLTGPAQGRRTGHRPEGQAVSPQHPTERG
jgi:hypothetical protein